jgi:alanyl-tRNA synthetase
VALVRDGKAIDSLGDGEQATVVLAATPFYAESGGQVGDTGVLRGEDGRFDVTDTVKLAGTFHGHVGTWRGGTLRAGERVAASVDGSRRQSTVLNHSATHLLHAALRKVLGEHVQQKGSLVAPDRLRFDFAHFQAVTPAELHRIEAMVNDEIRRNSSAVDKQMAMADALTEGAMALFGEKYGERVRVLRMGGDFSIELCGGTHVARTGDIGLFKIVSESGIAAGVRRIEAVTGAGALAWLDAHEQRLAELGRLLAASGDDAVEKLKQLLDRQRKLERELESLKSKAAGSALDEILSGAESVDGIQVVAARVNGLDAKALRDGVDQAKAKLNDCVVLLAAGARRTRRARRGRRRDGAQEGARR